MKRSLASSPVLGTTNIIGYPFKKSRYCFDPTIDNVLVDKIDHTNTGAQLLAHITESLKGKEVPVCWDDMLPRKQVVHSNELPIKANGQVCTDQNTKEDFRCVLEVEDFCRYIRDTFHDGSEAIPDSMWFSKYNELKNFYERYGNCYIHQNSVFLGPLGVWCTYMRYLNRNGTLSIEKKKLLDSIGFDFKTEWEKKYDEVNELVKQHRPIIGYHKCWMDKQHELLLQGKLDETCSRLLHSLDLYIKQTIQSQKSITREVVETLTFLSATKNASQPSSPVKSPPPPETTFENEDGKEEEEEQDEESLEENEDEEEEEIQETRKTKKRKLHKSKSKKSRKPPRGDSKQKWHDSYNELVKYYMKHGNTIINRGDNYHLGHGQPYNDRIEDAEDFLITK